MMMRLYQDKRWLGTRFLICLLLVLLTISVIAVSSALVSAQTNIAAHNAAQQKAAAPQKTSNQAKNIVSTTPVTVAQQSGAVPAAISMDALSPTLAAYLTTLGTHAGVEVYDVTHQRTYSYGNTTQFITGSSIKVSIMCAFFAQEEKEGSEPDASDMNLLTTMIENSDNDAATALFNDIGRAAGLSAYLMQIGITTLIPDNDAWGYSQITPATMVELLTKLHDGTILTATDRATALNLMGNIENDQQWGVGESAPNGATFAKKNGWLPGPDGLWTVNSSGIVTAGKETYILSVYTQEQQSFAAGQALVGHICSGVVAALQKN
jgi:beta-lactamase class A